MPAEKSDSVLVAWYADRFGEPLTADEAYGYSLYVLGALLAVAGVAVYLTTSSRGTTREVGFVLAGGGFALALTGSSCCTRPASESSRWRAPWRRWSSGRAGRGRRRSRRWRRPAPRTSNRGPNSPTSGSRSTSATSASPNSRRRSTTPRPTAESESERAEFAEAHLQRLEESQATFEVYRDRAEKWRWRLVHRNGTILATGGEGYAGRSSAVEAVNGVKRNAPNADEPVAGEGDDAEADGEEAGAGE
jgi:uncharacterized protein YegP (UPF0339 family)